MIEAPWFEDFNVGDDFSDVPSVTLTDGYAALHQSMFGDRSRLPLDRSLCEKVTGQNSQLVNPSLLCNMAIGQSTVPSQRVMGNLFYRGLVIQKPVFIGDTLTTSTRVVAMKQNKIREGRAASGMVVLEIDVRNQRDDTVMHFWRCPMIPCRAANADTGCNDSFDEFPGEISPTDLALVIPDWNYAAFSAAVTSKHFSDYAIGDQFEIEARDTVTSAPELVRFTLNLAMTHTDASRSVYGKRLVYGGHTISIAAAQVSRAIPNLLTTLAWYHCDHVSPVFEGDILRSTVRVNDTVACGDLSENSSIKGAGILRMHVEVFADRGDQAPEPGNDIKVLDWELAGLLAE